MAAADDLPQLWGGLLCCAHCRSLLRCRTHTDRGYAYFVEERVIRDMACPFAGRSVRTDVLDRQWELVLAAVPLPVAWRQQFSAYVRGEDAALKFLRQRDLWNKKLRRTQELYLEGAIERDEHDARIAKARTALSELDHPERLHPVDVRPYLENLLVIWQVATTWERRGWLVQWLRRAYCDSETNTLVWIEPHPAFQVLFREAGVPEPEPALFDIRSFGDGLQRPEHRRKVRPERIDEIRQLREEGLTLRELGERFGISYERVRQLLNRTD